MASQKNHNVFSKAGALGDAPKYAMPFSSCRKFAGGGSARLHLKYAMSFSSCPKFARGGAGPPPLKYAKVTVISKCPDIGINQNPG